jgi:hypothetical protein
MGGRSPTEVANLATGATPQGAIEAAICPICCSLCVRGTADPRPLLVICATQHTGVLCCALQHGSKKAN